jgi:DNA-directed RNA polymerase subunit RPC12/RpoP
MWRESSEEDRWSQDYTCGNCGLEYQVRIIINMPNTRTQCQREIEIPCPRCGKADAFPLIIDQGDEKA